MAARKRRLLNKEDPMVRHLVMWKIKATDERTKEENMKEMKARLMGLKGQIEELKDIAVGLNDNTSEMAYDIVLETSFDSKEELDAYQIHPKHQAVGGFVKTIAMARVVVDYEI
jgi:hypothetical protein